MSSSVSSRPARRSPLETVHAALGARWISDSLRVPSDYGSPDSERAAVQATGGLAELAPRGGLLVTSDRAIPSLEHAGLPVTVGQVEATDGAELWGLATNEVL